jgi:uracil-DNA glycosylase family 4
MGDFCVTDRCRSCPITKPAQITRQNPGADIALVVDFPTYEDTVRGTFLQGQSGILARRTLEEYGIDVDDCYITSALNCKPAKDKKGALKNAMLSCRQRLVDELHEVNPTKVLSLGPLGFSALRSAPDNYPITKVRGRWHRCFGIDVLATFSPVTLMGAFEYFRDFEWDVQKFATTQPEPTPRVEMWVPDTIAEAHLAFDYISGASFVSLDIESTGFSPYRNELLAVGLGVLFEDSTDGVSIVFDKDLLDSRDVWEEFEYLLQREDQATVMHNAKFDLKWMKASLEAMGLEFVPRRIEDTMLLNYCLDERAMGQFQSHSLKNMARVRCDAPDYDIEMGKWIKAWTVANDTQRDILRAKMRTYLSLDCYYTARLFSQLPDEVAEESIGLMSLYTNLLIPGALALCDIESHGVAIDRKFYEDTWATIQERAAPILARVREQTGLEEFNPNSPQQVRKYLYEINDLPVLRTARRGKLQEGPTSKPVLKMLKKEFPSYAQVIDDILEYRNLVKTAGTYVKGMMDRADDDDRIRGDFLQHGTSTGRLSSSNPNLQNIPETSHTKIEIRNGFVAPPDFVLLNADYSQLELRLAAHLSNDENFSAVFIEGRDPHQEVAFAFFDKPEDQISPYERYMAKCVNFGVAYGRGAESIALGPEMEYVEEIGGQRWSVEQVKQFFTAYFDHFPEFLAWCEDQKRFAYRHQYVESPLGRRRRFPLILRNDAGAVGRQAVNTPIQGTASDFTFSALIRIHKRLCDLNARCGRVVAFIVSTVHDSLLIECHKRYVRKVTAIVHQEMENVPLASRVPFECEVKIGTRWGDLHKIDKEEDVAIATASDD